VNAKTDNGGQGRLVLVVIFLVLAIAAAVWSIGRTIKSTQGENKGTLQGFASKSELMKPQAGQNAEPGAGTPAAPPMEGPPGSGMEGPGSGPAQGGKGSGQ